MLSEYPQSPATQQHDQDNNIHIKLICDITSVQWICRCGYKYNRQKNFIFGSRILNWYKTFLKILHFFNAVIHFISCSGFKYVPPADSRIEVITTSSSNSGNRQCVPCKRGIGLSEGPSSKFLWGTTAAPTTTTTVAPCCPDSTKLQNATGVYNVSDYL